MSAHPLTSDSPCPRDPAPAARELFRRIETAARPWPRPGATGPVSLILDLPNLHLGAAPALDPGDTYWSAPGEGLRLLGRGRALTLTAEGPGRLNRLSHRATELGARWELLDPDATGIAPVLFAGFAFDGEDPMQGVWRGFPNSSLVVPELLAHQAGGRCRLVLTAAPGQDGPPTARWTALALPLLAPPVRPSDPAAIRAPLRLTVRPSDARWLELASLALTAVRDGRLKKLVLSRQVRVSAAAAAHPHQVLDRLERAFPECRLFAARVGGGTLVSASPERLLRKRAGRVVCDAVAGTAPRGETPDADLRLAEGLRRSPKIREEHDLVVGAVADALRPLCRELVIDPQPTLRRLRNVQHLWSQVAGVLQGDTGLLELADRLHPTPAVNGTPRPDAQDWLRRHETPARGWFSGAAGWLDLAGDGELAVLLRSALLRGETAELFAGAGLVAGSDPEAELRETELKLAAVLEALGPA